MQQNFSDRLQQLEFQEKQSKYYHRPDFCHLGASSQKHFFVPLEFQKDFSETISQYLKCREAINVEPSRQFLGMMDLDGEGLRNGLMILTLFLFLLSKLYFCFLRLCLLALHGVQRKQRLRFSLTTNGIIIASLCAILSIAITFFMWV